MYIRRSIVIFPENDGELRVIVIASINMTLKASVITKSLYCLWYRQNIVRDPVRSKNIANREIMVDVRMLPKGE